MVAHIASYFFGPKPVHLTDMYWRDQNRTIELWTSENVVGRRSAGQDLFILVGPSTFSAAEHFCYSLQQLNRATIVGEKTGGGAHVGRGLQRLSPLFTSFIPTGQSLNPITKSNWENVGRCGSGCRKINTNYRRSAYRDRRASANRTPNADHLPFSIRQTRTGSEREPATERDRAAQRSRFVIACC